MTNPARPEPGSSHLPVRRSYPVEVGGRPGVVIEIDATSEPRALAVQQAGLHPLPVGHRLGFGYDLDVYGLGAWIDDRRVRLRVWPVEADETGTVIDEADPDDPDAETLVVLFHPERDAVALAEPGPHRSPVHRRPRRRAGTSGAGSGHRPGVRCARSARPGSPGLILPEDPNR